MTVPTTDQHARNRIREALDESLCIEAGAGTGKTTALVARVVEVLRTGYATVDDIAVITFTEAAASSLPGVSASLEHALASESDPDAGERIETALTGLYRAHVETIHAFAATLLRERPVGGSRSGVQGRRSACRPACFRQRICRLPDGAPRRLSARSRDGAQSRFGVAQIRTLADVVDRNHRSSRSCSTPSRPRTSTDSSRSTAPVLRSSRHCALVLLAMRRPCPRWRRSSHSPAVLRSWK